MISQKTHNYLEVNTMEHPKRF